MDKEQKIKFVESLIESIKDDVLADIDLGVLPEEWDGHELRQLLADKFDAARMTHAMGHKRLKEYKNFILVNNLI